MTRPIVVLDRQHAGKPNSADQGAPFPDGTTEAAHAMAYIEAARPLLEAAGVDVVVLTTGAYPDRNLAGSKLGAALYVACHVNAGGGDYALTEYSVDAGDVRGSAAAALALVQHAGAELGERVVGPKPLKAGERGHVCVGACTVPAVIFEPYFVEHPHLDATDVARSLVAGVLAFLRLEPAPAPPAPTPSPAPPAHPGKPTHMILTLKGSPFSFFVRGVDGAGELVLVAIEPADLWNLAAAGMPHYEVDAATFDKLRKAPRWTGA